MGVWRCTSLRPALGSNTYPGYFSIHICTTLSTDKIYRFFLVMTSLEKSFEMPLTFSMS